MKSLIYCPADDTTCTLSRKKNQNGYSKYMLTGHLIRKTQNRDFLKTFYRWQWRDLLAKQITTHIVRTLLSIFDICQYIYIWCSVWYLTTSFLLGKRITFFIKQNHLNKHVNFPEWVFILWSKYIINSFSSYILLPNKQSCKTLTNWVEMPR